MPTRVLRIEGRRGVERGDARANVAADDQRGATGEREAFRFLEAGDDLRDPLL